MKTAVLLISRSVVTVLPLTAAVAYASWNLSADADGRLAGWRKADAELHTAGVSLRKTFADAKGDRFTAFTLIEAEHNASSVMAHEMYGRYKGPMGVWNATVGRFTLPFGLLVNFSTTRLLYRSLDVHTLGMDVDNGLQVSGTSWILDYAAAVTQGYGPHRALDVKGKGLAVGRVGVTLGEAEESVVGISGAYGRTATGHGGMDSTARRVLAGADATLYRGRAVIRGEIDGGKIEGRGFAAVFCAVDFGLLPRLDLTVAGSFVRHGRVRADETFIGLAVRPTWFTIRGGYRYAYDGTDNHEVALQLYRLFSWYF